MDQTCPVCGDPVEYVDDRPAAAGAAGMTIDVEELCRVEADRRWDRICVRAVVSEGEAGLEEYRHHWDGD